MLRVVKTKSSVDKKEKSLVLFFTRGVSLQHWINSGVLNREKKIYESLLDKKVFDKIYWFTYGSDDQDLAKNLYAKNLLDNRIIIVQKNIFYKGKFLEVLYSFLIIFIHYKIIRVCNLVKTNQINGSWVGLLAKVFLRRPLYLRCGFLLSRSEKLWNRRSFLAIKLMIYLEKIMFTFCDISSVTNKGDKEYILKELKIKNYPKVINSFIDQKEFFYFNKDEEEEFLFVGRLSYEKNLINIFKALNKLNLKLNIIGDGKEKKVLENLAKEIGLDVNFLGVIDNLEINNKLNSYKYFILCSLSEGLPKSLLEAMSAGRICVGTNVPGISSVIQDGKNGFLSYGLESKDIQIAIENAINYPDTEKIRSNSIKYISNNHSFDKFFIEVTKTIESVMI